jgi:hypothetical protein
MAQTERLRRVRSALRQVSQRLLYVSARAYQLLDEERAAGKPCEYTMDCLQNILDEVRRLDNTIKLPYSDDGGPSTVRSRHS